MCWKIITTKNNNIKKYGVNVSRETIKKMEESKLNTYSIIVIGAGIAGSEAAIICAKMRLKTLIINISMDNPAWLKYSSKLGGVVKTKLLREIQYLGGFISKAIYENKIAENIEKENKTFLPSYIADKRSFSLFYKFWLENNEYLDTRQGLVTTIDECILKEKGKYKITLSDGSIFYTREIIIAAGTFLNANIFWGENIISAGRHGEINSNGLYNNLKIIGYEFQQSEAYISPGIDKKTIDLKKVKKVQSKMCKEIYLDEYKNFNVTGIREKYYSYKSKTKIKNLKKKLKLFKKVNSGNNLNYLNCNRGKLIENIEGKKLKNDEIEINLFHAGRNTMEFYADGFLSVLSDNEQQLLLNEFFGLKDSIIIRPGYCIKYYSIKTEQIKNNMESKIHKGIFFAGEITGVNSYEEASAQGMVAGLNAALNILENKDLLFNKEDSLIGLVIDKTINGNLSSLSYSIFEDKINYKKFSSEDLELRMVSYFERLKSYKF